MKNLIRFGFVFLLLTGMAFGQGRALTVEDYYKVKTVGDPQISPNGKWVAFTVSTKMEEDNTTAIETYVVPVDGSAQPRKIQHEGKDVANPRWTDDNMLQYSLNARVNSAIFLGSVGMDEGQRGGGGGAGQGALWKVSVDTPSATPVRSEPRPQGAVLSFDDQWIAQAKEKPRVTPAITYASDFEKRHMERFKGKQFDWMRFQQDGQEFPVPDPRLRPAAEITITPAGGELFFFSSCLLCPRIRCIRLVGSPLLSMQVPGNGKPESRPLHDCRQARRRRHGRGVKSAGRTPGPFRRAESIDL